MSRKLIIRICAGLIGFSGLIILFSSLFSIIFYEWQSAKRYPILISPLVDENTASFKFSKKDYTRASNWFDKEAEFSSQVIKYYTLSIPKLKIENATVAIGGEDLSQSLIQYPGTALPGKVGNSVIFGHSVLPIFFDPKNYLSIFSTLYKLEKKDWIYVDYDGITYRYEVEDMFEVKPSGIEILEQNSSESFLTLVTCTPPGDPRKPKRLIVRARLVPALNANANIGHGTKLE